MPTPEFCGAWGFAVSFGVELLKKVPLVQKYPQWAALVVSAILQVLIQVPGTPTYALPVRELALCILSTWATSIATHEVVTNAIKR